VSAGIRKVREVSSRMRAAKEVRAGTEDVKEVSY
jgi:hypothetical protein